ncbi:hypothetical protein ANCCAN_23312 [Ancylostoma caninum]|uniref:Uncharacterized protein n=1 Tax=Ancylostoma caninum TaxID=29170 RepID=A0A368FH94_ANCCA|nr:hypothetical protein ANCCAN_23312 [Ancylostoma caninum]
MADRLTSAKYEKTKKCGDMARRSFSSSCVVECLPNYQRLCMKAVLQFLEMFPNTWLEPALTLVAPQNHYRPTNGGYIMTLLSSCRKRKSRGYVYSVFPSCLFHLVHHTYSITDKSNQFFCNNIKFFAKSRPN